MLRLLYSVIKDFGAFGVGLASIGINGFLFWKLFTNHLKHLAVQIKDVGEDVKRIDKEISPIKERISTIEGILK